MHDWNALFATLGLALTVLAVGALNVWDHRRRQELSAYQRREEDEDAGREACIW